MAGPIYPAGSRVLVDVIVSELDKKTRLYNQRKVQKAGIIIDVATTCAEIRLDEDRSTKWYDWPDIVAETSAAGGGS